jgi:hypothetical protein
MITQVGKLFVINIVFLRFGFLQADDVSRIGLHPIHKTFIHGSAQSVYVITNDAHGFID